MAAMLMALVALALAPVPLGAGPRPDLVHVAGVGAGGDEPTAAALVGVEDLVRVELEQAQAAKDVSGFGGGWARVALYSGAVHRVHSLWAVPPGSLDPPAGASYVVWVQSTRLLTISKAFGTIIFVEYENGERMSELLEIIGRNVRRLREEKGWNQTELGFHADTSPSIISLIENGKRNPSTATLAKIAGALGVEVADLFPKADAPPSPEPEGVSEEERRYLRALFGSWGHHINDQNEKWGPLLRDLPEDPTAEEYESGCKVIEEAFATYESILNAMARYGVLETLDRFVDDLQDDEPVPDEIRQ
ncbi:MAG: hypothetical protein CYG60_19520, partial [Actinobacteria bacterium]